MTYNVTYTIWELENGNDWVDNVYHDSFPTLEEAQSYILKLKEKRNVVHSLIFIDEVNTRPLKDFWDVVDKMESKND